MGGKYSSKIYVPSTGQTLSILLYNLRAVCEGFLAGYTIGFTISPFQTPAGCYTYRKYLKSLKKRKFDKHILALGCWVEVSVSNHLGYWESSHHLRGNDALSLMQRRRNKCIVAKVDIERNSLALPTFKRQIERRWEITDFLCLVFFPIYLQPTGHQ